MIELFKYKVNGHQYGARRHTRKLFDVLLLPAESAVIPAEVDISQAN